MPKRFRKFPTTSPFRHLAGLSFALVFATGLSAHDMSRPNADAGPTSVELGMMVLNVDEIDSAHQKFTINLFYIAQWNDPRLAHQGKSEISKPLTDVWHPRLQILNQQKLVRTFPEMVEISPRGDVVYRQRVWGSFSQPMDVKEFPADEQIFRIQMVSAGYNSDEVSFKINTEYINDFQFDFSVADWKLSNWKQGPVQFLPHKNIEPMAYYELSFQANRLLPYYLLKVIMPLALIVAMSWSVFWINPEQAGVQIGIATTSMLTLIAYRFMVSGSLPPVSYITDMDFLS